MGRGRIFPFASPGRSSSRSTTAIPTISTPSFTPHPLSTRSISSGSRGRAADLYAAYSGRFKSRFKWLPTGRFLDELTRDLKADVAWLLDVLAQCGEWDPDRDAKLERLTDLLTRKHPQEKVIVFSQ